MGFFKHSNGRGVRPVILGQFWVKNDAYDKNGNQGALFEYAYPGALFEYSDRGDEVDPWCPEFPHRVAVGHGETRVARVLKTVAHVVIDEDEEGKPVVERWKISQHRLYYYTPD